MIYNLYLRINYRTTHGTDFIGLKNKKPFVTSYVYKGFLSGARDWTRTSMLLKAPPSEDGMSTNFTTRAWGK